MGDLRVPAGPVLGAGFAAAWLVLEGVPEVPPPERWQWILALALVAGGVGAFEHKLPFVVRWAVRVGAASAFVALVVKNPTVAWFALPIAGIALVCAGLDAVARATDARLVPLVLAITFGIAAPSLFVSGTQGMAKLAAACAAISAILWIAGWVKLRVESRSAAFFGGAVLVGLLVLAVRYADLPVAAAALLGAAPLAAAVTSRWPSTLVRAGSAAILAAAGAAVAVAHAWPLSY